MTEETPTWGVDPLDELEEFAYGDDREPDAQLPTSAIEANELLGRRNRLERKMAEDKAVAEAMIAKAREWLTDRLTVRANQIERVDWALKGWHRAVLDEDPSQLTIKLPNGELTARKISDEWVYDEEPFKAWAEANNHKAMLRVTTEVAKTEAKKRLVIGTGTVDNTTRVERCKVMCDDEVVPGVEVVRHLDRKFNVKGTA
jgi:hypothetical protein